MNKKFLVLSFVMLLLICVFTVNVYAFSITSATITMTTSNTEVKPGDTIEFTVSLKDLNADSGIIGLGAYVTYDSNVLELDTHTKGLSGWESCVISSKTNRFATTKGEFSGNNEDILTISFKVKEISSDTTTTVGLRNIEISNGSEYRISSVTSNFVNIKVPTTIPDNPNTPDTPDNPNPPDNPNTPSNPDNPNNPSNPDNPTNPGDNQNTNTPGTSNTVDNNISGSTTNGTNTSTNTPSANKSNSDLPNLGANPNLGFNKYILIVLLIMTAIVIILPLKIIKINKKINDDKQRFISENEEDNKDDNKNE